MVGIAGRGLCDLAHEQCLVLVIAALAQNLDGADDFLIKERLALVLRDFDPCGDGRNGGCATDAFGGELAIELIEQRCGVGVIKVGITAATRCLGGTSGPVQPLCPGLRRPCSLGVQVKHPDCV